MLTPHYHFNKNTQVGYPVWRFVCGDLYGDEKNGVPAGPTAYL